MVNYIDNHEDFMKQYNAILDKINTTYPNEYMSPHEVSTLVLKGLQVEHIEYIEFIGGLDYYIDGWLWNTIDDNTRLYRELVGCIDKEAVISKQKK